MSANVFYTLYGVSTNLHAYIQSYLSVGLIEKYSSIYTYINKYINITKPKTMKRCLKKKNNIAKGSFKYRRKGFWLKRNCKKKGINCILSNCLKHLKPRLPQSQSQLS